MLQNEKCHLLIENETQRLKMLDEQHNYMMKDWREQLKPRKKVCCLHPQFHTQTMYWSRGSNTLSGKICGSIPPKYYHHVNLYIFKSRLTGNDYQKHTEMCSVWIEYQIKIKMLLFLSKVVINANNCKKWNYGYDIFARVFWKCFHSEVNSSGSRFILKAYFTVAMQINKQSWPK